MSVLKTWNNNLITGYQASHTKPDKLYSILPSILLLAGDLHGKTVLDLGCGDGFFTKQLAEKSAKMVIGIDNSKQQIYLAKTSCPQKNCNFRLGNIFQDPLPRAEVIVAPFFINYAKNVHQLADFFWRLYNALTKGGRIILVYDLPSGANLQRFGARKILQHPEDGSEIITTLFNKTKIICTITAHYFKKTTVYQLLKETGFSSITSHIPIISEKGIAAFGKKFWSGYPENCELGYLTAQKI